MIKPQIVSYDFGSHNATGLSTSRIVKGATWKKQRIVMLLPASETMATKVALSHMNLMFPPNQAVYRMLCMGMEVGHAYSEGIEQILANPQLSDWEYILTVESDNIPPPDGVLKLIEAMEKYPQFSCIGGLYWCKGPGGVPHLWGCPQEDPIINYRPQPPIDGIMENYGTSMGFHLWRLSMFKDERLKKPWFRTISSAEEGMGTQDLAFWSDARKYGYRCAVDCNIKVGHYDFEGKFGPPDFTW